MNQTAKISEYEGQALDFLQDTGTTLTVVSLYTGPHFDTDTDERDIYQFTLTNEHGSYSAKFGDSLNNTKMRQMLKRKSPLSYKEDYSFCRVHKINVSSAGYIQTRKQPEVPSNYDILACLDSYAPDTFADFCSEYGYDDQPLSSHDSVMKTFLAVREQTAGLNKLFNQEQLQQLAEIA
jgi:hypothetical protein